MSGVGAQGGDQIRLRLSELRIMVCLADVLRPHLPGLWGVPRIPLLWSSRRAALAHTAGTFSEVLASM